MSADRAAPLSGMCRAPASTTPPPADRPADERRDEEQSRSESRRAVLACFSSHCSLAHCLPGRRWERLMITRCTVNCTRKSEGSHVIRSHELLLGLTASLSSIDQDEDHCHHIITSTRTATIICDQWSESCTRWRPTGLVPVTLSTSCEHWDLSHVV